MDMIAAELNITATLSGKLKQGLPLKCMELGNKKRTKIHFSNWHT